MSYSLTCGTYDTSLTVGGIDEAPEFCPLCGRGVENGGNR